MPTPRRSGSTSARRRADEQTTSARCRTDVNYCRCGGRRTDVGLTSVCLLGWNANGGFVSVLLTHLLFYLLLVFLLPYRIYGEIKLCIVSILYNV